MSACEDDLKDLQFWGFEKENLSREAQEGLDHIFSGDLFRSALPVSIYKDFLKDDSVDGVKISSQKGQFMMYGRLPSPSKREGTLPWVFLSLGNSIVKRQGSYFISENCFSCHAGVVNGKVVAGMGNSHIDQTSIYSDLQKLIAYSKSKRPIQSDNEEEEFLHFLNYAETVMMPIFRFAKSRGDNLGPFGVWRNISRLVDPQKQGLKMYLSSEKGPLDDWFYSQYLVTVDPNPWWHLKYKKSCYRYGDADPYDANHFSMNFTHSHPLVNENHETHVRMISKALAFARETTSPVYPHTLDAFKVELGRRLFHGELKPKQGEALSCYRCHGVYEKRIEFLDFSRPGGWEVYYRDKNPIDVGTDPVYSSLLLGFSQLTERLQLLSDYYDRQGKPELTPQFHIPKKEGYVCPPLDGVWASAPYFHNGSVPTIELVLNSKKRPTFWKREFKNPFLYDLRNLGLIYQEVSNEEYKKLMKETTLDSVHFRSVYNTQDIGRHNTGHTFGDILTDEERIVVIEFLKSLSGMDMKKAH